MSPANPLTPATPGRLTREQKFEELHSLRVWLDSQRLSLRSGVARDVMDGQIAALNEVIESLSPRAAEGETPPPALVEVVRKWQAAMHAASDASPDAIFARERADEVLAAYPLPAPVAGEGDTNDREDVSLSVLREGKPSAAMEHASGQVPQVRQSVRPDAGSGDGRLAAGEGETKVCLWPACGCPVVSDDYCKVEAGEGENPYDDPSVPIPREVADFHAGEGEGERPEHRCGVQGFNQMLGDVCPACNAREQKDSTK